MPDTPVLFRLIRWSMVALMVTVVVLLVRSARMAPGARAVPAAPSTP